MLKCSMLKRVTGLFTAIAVFLAFNCTVFAQEATIPYIQSMASEGISGSASMNADKQATFTVNTSGSRGIANAMIIVNGVPVGESVHVGILRPDGTGIDRSGGSSFYQNETQYVNFYNAKTGSYRVTVVPSRSNFWFSVIVVLSDGAA